MSYSGVETGRARFRWGSRTFVMGILNATPDSFSGDGLHRNPERVTAAALAMAADGADVVDIGGVSSRPGAAAVDADTELDRVMPVLNLLAGRLAVPISIDTTKPRVAQAALRAGASIINDIHGLRAEPDLASLAARHGAAVVVMANLRGVAYRDVVEAVITQLRQSCAVATAAGLPPERVIVDPGFGFGPPPEDNLAVVRRLREVRALGHPVLLGPSRKATIGRVLGLPVTERLEGTAALVALAVAGGADMVRVHDVRAMGRVVRMADAVMRGWQQPASPPAEGAA